jgi:hypothetical protein
MQLIQKKFPNIKKFELQKKSVQIYNKTLTEELEYTIDYLELGNKLIKKKNTNNKIAEIFFLVFFGLEFSVLIHTLIFNPKREELAFWIFACAFFLSLYFIARFSQKTNLIYITGGNKTLELFQNKPNDTTVNEFIAELQKKIKEAYKKKYLTFDEQIPFEIKKNQIEWLNSIEILTDSETETLISEQKIKKSENIGFKN